MVILAHKKFPTTLAPLKLAAFPECGQFFQGPRTLLLQPLQYLKDLQSLLKFAGA
jgi:hypothetical protein